MPGRFLIHPFRFGAQGGVAVTGDANQHLADKVEAILFTAPGERVNNPSFGVGLNRATFEPLNDLTLSALEFRIAQGLRRDAGDDLIVDSVELTSDPDSGELTLSLAFHLTTDHLPRNLEVKL